MAIAQTAPALARLTEQANNFARSGRFIAARSMLAAIRKQHDGTAEIDEIEARVCIGEGRIGEACAALNQAIARTPGEARFHLLRADVRARMDDLAGAARDASEAVCLRPEDPSAKAMLGLLLLELDETDDALACLRESVRDEPRAAPSWRGLSEALRRSGDPIGAAAALDAAIQHIPGNVGLRTAAMVLALGERDFERACELGAAARAAGVSDACVFGLHGHTLSHLTRHAEASEAYQEALKLAPEDVYVRHLVRAAGLLPGSERAPDPYLETVFDGYADRFENHLIGLGYRVPGLVRAAVLLAEDGSPARPLGRVLDLGCGTGLVGVALSDLPMDDLTGIDLSANMLTEAAGKDLYTNLVRQEIGVFLDQDTRLWDTIIAADVFCYFGAIDQTLAAVRARLRPGGAFIFSIEELAADAAPDGPEWRLASQGRFQHTYAYVERSIRVAGFTGVALRRETLRLESGAPVAGLIVTLRLERTPHVASDNA